MSLINRINKNPQMKCSNSNQMTNSQRRATNQWKRRNFQTKAKAGTKYLEEVIIKWQSQIQKET